MIISADPTGPMPPPDGTGQVIIVGDTANIMLLMAGGFILSAMVLVSALYWAVCLSSGHFPALDNPAIAFLFQLGFMGIPALPVVFAELLFPPRLTITNAGVSLRRQGSTHAIFWDDLTTIDLQERLGRNRYGEPAIRTYCRLSGREAQMIIAPVFGVRPLSLAAHILDRARAHAARDTAQNIAITQSFHAGMPMRIKLQLFMLVTAGVFLIAVVALTYGIEQQAPAALTIARHLLV